MYKSERHFGLGMSEQLSQGVTYKLNAPKATMPPASLTVLPQTDLKEITSWPPLSEAEIRTRADQRAAEWLQANQGEAFDPEADRYIPWIIMVFLLIAFACTLSACGGGEEGLDRKSTIEPVRCTQQGTPGVCS